MTEAPPICHNISVTTFIPSRLVFHITARIGLLFSNFCIRISLQRNVGNEVIWPNFFENFAYLPWNPLCILQSPCWQPLVTVSVTSNVNFRP